MYTNKITSYSLEEMKDTHIGKKGTPIRDKYEHEVRRAVLENVIKKTKQDKLTSKNINLIFALTTSGQKFIRVKYMNMKDGKPIANADLCFYLN